jgi:hypothetical protein
MGNTLFYKGDDFINFCHLCPCSLYSIGSCYGK